MTSRESHRIVLQPPVPNLFSNLASSEIERHIEFGSIWRIAGCHPDRVERGVVILSMFLGGPKLAHETFRIALDQSIGFCKVTRIAVFEIGITGYRADKTKDI